MEIERNTSISQSPEAVLHQVREPINPLKVISIYCGIVLVLFFGIYLWLVYFPNRAALAAIDKQLTYLKKDDIQAAYELNNQEYRTYHTVTDYVTEAKKYPAYSNNKAYNLKRVWSNEVSYYNIFVNIIKRHLGFRGTLTGEDGDTISVIFRLTPEKGEWKLGFYFYTDTDPSIIPPEKLQVITQQLDLLKNKDMAGAYNLTAGVYKTRCSLQCFIELTEKYPAFSDNQSYSLKLNEENSLNDITGILTGKDGSKVAVMYDFSPMDQGLFVAFEPEKAVQVAAQFIELMRTHDYQSAYSLTSQEYQKEYSFETFSQNNYDDLDNYQVKFTFVSAVTANIEFTFTMKTGRTRDTRCELLQEGGEWRVHETPGAIIVMQP